jgi:C-22 sterol desaturase
MNSNMAFEMSNISLAQNELPQIWPSNHLKFQSCLASLTSFSVWQYAVTFLIAILVYDQGKQSRQDHKNLLISL